jgi:glucose uptake protein
MAVAFPMGIGVATILGTILAYVAKSTGNPALMFAGCALIAGAVAAAALAYRFHAVLRHEELARAGKAASTRRPSSIKGIVLALVSGLLMGSFFPLVDKAREGDLGLGPYAVAVVFAAGVFFSTFVFNVFLMNLPVEGEPLEVLDIFKSTPKQHLLGLAGGAVWCTGMVTSLAASAPAVAQVGTVEGYFLAQGFPLIAALWGILAWKELKGADLRVKALAVFMFLLFVCGLLLISQAPLHVRAA